MKVTAQIRADMAQEINRMYDILENETKNDKACWQQFEKKHPFKLLRKAEKDIEVLNEKLKEAKKILKRHVDAILPTNYRRYSSFYDNKEYCSKFEEQAKREYSAQKVQILREKRHKLLRRVHTATNMVDVKTIAMELDKLSEA